MPHRRAGFGVPLVVVLGVILVLMSLGMSLGVRSQGVTRSVRRAVFRDEAEAFAQAAVQEALYRLRVGANRPGAIFDALRVPEVPADAARLRLGPDALVHTAAMLSRDGRYSLADGGVTVEVLRRGSASLEPAERVGYEAPGVLQLRARVVGPMGITGSKVVDYGFRCVLTSAPRPFDTATFFLADPLPLLRREAYLGEPNAAISQTVKQIDTLRQTVEDMARAFADLEAEAGDDPPSEEIARRLKESYTAALQEGTWPARAWTVRPEASAETLENEDEIHLFYPDLMVYSLADDLELAELDLPTRFATLVPSIEAGEPRLLELSAAIQAALPPSDLDEIPGIGAMADEYLAAVLAHVALQEEMLAAYKLFQARVIEVGGAAREVLLARYRRYQLEDQVWKTPYLFEGAEAVARATRFLGEHPEGMVVVRGAPGDELVVDLEGYQGRLVLVCDVPVRLARVTVADPTRDAVTILAHRGLEVAGRVQAGLHALGGTYRSSGGSFQGALHLNTVPEDGALELIFRGNLQRQEALASAPLPSGGGPLAEPAPELVHVVLGAEPLRREVEL